MNELQSASEEREQVRSESESVTLSKTTCLSLVFLKKKAI